MSMDVEVPSSSKIPTPADIEIPNPTQVIDQGYIDRFITATKSPPQEIRDGILTIMVPTGRIQEDMARIPRAATEAAYRAIEARGWKKIGEEPLGGREHGRYDLWQPNPTTVEHILGEELTREIERHVAAGRADILTVK